MKRRNVFRTALVVWAATGAVLAALWAGADAWAQGEEVGNTMRERSWLAARPLPEVVVTLDRASYAPGQKVTMRVEPADGFAATPGDVARLEIVHLTQVVAQLVGTEDGAGWKFVWDPPAKPAGYGLVAWVERDGKPVAYGESALDVAVDWTEQPRYGFVSEFGAWDEAKERAAFAKMNRLHLNGVQFYDWQYRHEELVPPTERFVDSLGRELFVSTIERKIALAREYGMAPMAYTAIYAASGSFYLDHRDWGLYDASGKVIDFGDGYLYLMNPSRGSGWRDHLIEQFRQVLRRFDFEGIHVDQYGYPRAAYDHEGGMIVMARAFREFIDDAKEALSREFDRNDLTFNSVANWPAAVMAQSAYDFNYIEVWPPYVTYGDVERIIQDAYEHSNGKATVIAAYVDPEAEATVRLFNAVIFANGGTHIEMGEGDGMLADPYFPKFRRVSASLWQAQVKAYDFIVRYKEWLYGPRKALNASERVTIAGQPAPARPEPGKVHAVLYRAMDDDGPGRRHVLSLINLSGATSVEWRAHQPEPPVIEDLAVTLTMEVEPEAVWVASPDGASLGASQLPFAVEKAGDDGFVVRFLVPRLHYWTVVAVE